MTAIGQALSAFGAAWNTTKPSVGTMPKIGTMSAAGRKRIAAAQRARWAKVRAGKESARETATPELICLG